VGTETNLHVAAHEFLEDEFDRALEVADGDVLVHVKPFDLVEGRIVRGVGVVAAIDAAGTMMRTGGGWDFITRIGRRRCVCGGEVVYARPHPALSPGRGRSTRRVVGEIERVLRVARGMVGGRVKRVEAMILILNLRPIGDGEADLRKARTMSSVT